MNAPPTPSPDSRPSEREQQGTALRCKEAELGRLAELHNREEFFKQILPLIEPLKDYVKRRLRIVYLDLEVRTPVETTGDILDRVIFKAYAEFRRKPMDLTLEQWLYQLADRILQSYIQRRKRIDARRRSLETLTKTELRTLEESITSDAEGEPWLVEDLDDAEIEQREFTPPADTENDPEKELERKEEVDMVLRTLSKVTERDRAIFELVTVEGFSEDVVSRMYRIPADKVRQIVKSVRDKVRGKGAAASQGTGEKPTDLRSTEKKKAS